MATISIFFLRALIPTVTPKLRNKMCGVKPTIHSEQFNNALLTLTLNVWKNIWKEKSREKTVSMVIEKMALQQENN